MFEGGRLLHFRVQRMSELPKSFFLLLAFVILAIVLIVFAAFKYFMFWRHKRSGDLWLVRADYANAFRSFCRAERLWDFNPNKDSTVSHQRDLEHLEEVLDGIQKAGHAIGTTLAVEEYRDALRDLKSHFDSDEKKSFDSKSYASAFMRLKSAQSTLREQLRVLNSDRGLTAR